ncbi:DUF5677 domain-containing protein [Namhaeicola litoreus]|uniref:DUF5677 domain-containing protein n=1 Tax=Namhaeicola litoreus TaxID=1052145 RepID=A0ABW3XZ49_9FLAO
MGTHPIEELLPRKTDQILQLALDAYSSSIDEVVNFGTHIILWDYKKKRDGKDNHIPTLFLRNIIEIGDSISILIKSSSIDPSKILIRSLLENFFQLLYMLEKDEKERAQCFMIYKAVNDLKYYKKFISSDPSSKGLFSKLEKDQSDFDITNLLDRDDFIKAIESKSSILKKPEFKDVYEEYLRTKKIGNGRNPNWYSLYDGPKNIEQLSTHLRRVYYYEFFYRSFSQNVHISDLFKGLALVGIDKAQMIQIRDFEDCHTVFIATNKILLALFIEYVQKRIPERNQEFRFWFNSFYPEYDKLVQKGQIKYKK